MKKRFLVGMLAMVLTCGFVLVGCGKDDDGGTPAGGGTQTPTGDAAKLQGTWNDTVDTQVLVFSGSNVTIGGTYTGTFAVNETTKKLTMTVSALTSGNVFTYGFSNSDNTLTLSGGESQINGTYAKAP